MPSLLIVLKLHLHYLTLREQHSTSLNPCWPPVSIWPAQRLLWLHLRVKEKLQTTWPQRQRQRWPGKSPHVQQPVHSEVPHQLQLTCHLCPMGQSCPTPTIVPWAPVLNRGWNHLCQQTLHPLQTPYPHPTHQFPLLETLLWGLLKVFLPKACTQRSLCRWSIAQSFEATAELGLWQRVNLTNKKECDVWSDCHVWLWL